MTRHFIKRAMVPAGIAMLALIIQGYAGHIEAAEEQTAAHEFNGPYTGRNLDQIAFPIGGIGAGMFCLDGAGAISYMSVRHVLETYNEPITFAALCVKGKGQQKNTARLIQGPIPDWKYFGRPAAAFGLRHSLLYGLPRYRKAEFLARFPFATVSLSDPAVPLETKIVGWSPFTPPDADASSLPVGALEYHFENTSNEKQEAVFSFHSKNFIEAREKRKRVGVIDQIDGGFVLYAHSNKDRDRKGAFAVFVEGEDVTVDHCWFHQTRQGQRSVTWQNVEKGLLVDNPPVDRYSPGASLFVPFTLKPGEKKTIRVMMAWYVPETKLRYGKTRKDEKSADDKAKLLNTASRSSADVCVTCDMPTPSHYVPWYATKYKTVQEVAADWKSRYDDLRRQSELFRDTFYSTTLPPEVIEAVAANLTILKTPTVLRQHDGRIWCFEGCFNGHGSCPGSCTHVWNYAMAICHLFPALERGLRQNEFYEGQNATGAQQFRGNLPVTPAVVGTVIPADGQLGGIMKAYREWRISGNRRWLATYWPKIKKSMDFAIKKWDPRHTGIPEEEQHNTYDINYYGPNGHCGSFYLGALAAAIKMGREMDADTALYQELLDKGRKRMESELYNGEYFTQIIAKKGLDRNGKLLNVNNENAAYRKLVEAINQQGPIYQYGKGCLSDGVLGLWMAKMCGLDDEIVDTSKVASHLQAVHKHNFKRDLSGHFNPQRPAFAMGDEGGLLTCTWPHGDELIIPLVYSSEVWTGIEYQVASHLMLLGEVDKGLEIVRACRKRYDGIRRNPFNEYECGNWYGRAMSSYGLLEGLTGVRYDAVSKTLSCDSKIGDFRTFLATNTGYGIVELKNGKLTLDVKQGKILVKKTDIR